MIIAPNMKNAQQLLKYLWPGVSGLTWSSDWTSAVHLECWKVITILTRSSKGVYVDGSRIPRSQKYPLATFRTKWLRKSLKFRPRLKTMQKELARTFIQMFHFLLIRRTTLLISIMSPPRSLLTKHPLHVHLILQLTWYLTFRLAIDFCRWSPSPRKWKPRSLNRRIIILLRVHPIPLGNHPITLPPLVHQFFAKTPTLVYISRQVVWIWNEKQTC